MEIWTQEELLQDIVLLSLRKKTATEERDTKEQRWIIFQYFFFWNVNINNTLNSHNIKNVLKSITVTTIRYKNTKILLPIKNFSLIQWKQVCYFKSQNKKH